METLFSFELLVDTIQMEMETKVTEEVILAVVLRLLDFPTLIIYQPQHNSGDEKEGEYTFNRGKACFFKMSMDTLHRHLTSTPLYAMVLDVKDEIPKFVGSSLISLSKVMDRIQQDAIQRGVSTPSSHGQRGAVKISNLKGEKVGTISLSYKLLSLGTSLLPHMDATNMSLVDKNNTKEADKLQDGDDNLQKLELEEGCKISNKEESIKQEKIPSESQEIDTYGEDMSVFCPPLLYYNNTAKERRKYEEESRKQLESIMNPIKSEDTEDEADTNPGSKEKRTNATNSSQEKQQVSTGDVTPNVIGQALRQMPLLNALLVELSQLNSPHVNQPLTVHPNLSWIYRPASTESTAVERKPQKTQIESKGKQVANPKSKDVFSPRCCSTPIQRERKNTLKKKLVYGTTKSFNLRLKQNSPVKVKQRECTELFESKTQYNLSKETSKSVKKITKGTKRRSTPSSKLTENIETMMQNITMNSTESFMEKQRKIDAAAKPIEIPHGDTSISEQPLVIESPPRLIQNPANAESDNSAKIYQSSPDSHTRKWSGSRSGRNSADSSLSDHSGGEEEDYADDFNSFETSVFSPDATSPSPELRRPKTPSELVRSSNSSPESVKKYHRAVIPVPIKAARSPQRTLRGTYTIQRPTFGVSFSSEEGNSGRTSSKLSAYLEKNSSREERSSVESLRSTSDCESKSRQSIKKFSDESSFEHKTERDDELGTLDFKKGYKHISELVANKLPGYTM